MNVTIERRKQQGLCPRCEGVPRPGKGLCITCADKKRSYNKARRAGRKKLNRCLACDHPTRPGKSYCIKCRDQRNQNVCYQSAAAARSILKQFLGMCGIQSVNDLWEVSDEQLENITKGHGWPDWKEEAIEEKGPKTDCLRSPQWARAILEYRSGRPYKVAWRTSRTESILFETVYDFYDWQQKNKDRRDLCESKSI